MARLICARMLSICEHYLLKGAKVQKESFIKVAPPTLADQAEERLRHRFIPWGKRYKCTDCYRCFTTAQLRKDLRIHVPCCPRMLLDYSRVAHERAVTLPKNTKRSVVFLGRVIHWSHTLGYRANTLFCWRCAAKAQQRVRTLSRPCHEPNAYTMRDFRVWLEKKPPDPIQTNQAFPATLLSFISEEGM